MSPADAFFILYLFVVLPVLALRGVRRIRKHATPVTITPRSKLATLFVHGMMLLLALLLARQDGIVLRFQPTDAAQATMLSALFLLLAAGWLAYRWKRAAPTDSVIPPEQLAPHGGTRWMLWIMTSCSAGIAEEIVYRGVGTTVLSWYVGGIIPASLISAASFGAVHASQGRRAMIVTGTFGLLAQGLIAVTGAVGPAIAVHIIYDVAAGWMLSRKYPLQPQSSQLALG
jgi:membrane protease YdiL (CAAX protease family)